MWKDDKLPYGHHVPGELLREGNVILLHVDDKNHITRQQGSIDLAGRPFHLENPGPPGQRMPFPTLPFYSILTGDPQSNDATTGGSR